ncbi:MAG: SH3 domain-containing protein [Anaerolineae bacterium]|nr:SH3 domain-containing protein [Anaerolineae bacterium]
MKSLSLSLQRPLALLLIVVLLIAAVPVVTAQGSAVGTVTANLNMRSGPGTGYARIGLIPYNTTVSLAGRDATGAWLYGSTPGGMTGWMFGTYVNVDAAAVLALPVMDASAGTSSGGTSAQPAAAPATTAGGFELGGHVRTFGYTSYMQTAGMTWAKVQVRYTYGQSASDVAGLISEAHANGFRILLGIVGDPGQLASIPDYITQYAAFVGGAAALGADGIEVWNEMNIDREWPQGRIDPNWYVQMLSAAYNSIKANNGNTLVISGALSPTGAEGAFGTDRVWNDDRYVAGMAAAGAAQYMDCIGVHYNEGIIAPSQRTGDPRGDTHYSRYFWGMMDTYWNAFGGARPLCFTELGYVTPEGYGTLPAGFAWGQNTTLSQQAAWLAEAASLARSSGRVRLMIIWNVDFLGFAGEDPQGGYAIVRPDGSCPACTALDGVM